MPSISNLPEIDFLGGQSLRLRRVHEFRGTARHLLALIAVSRQAGPVMWVRSDTCKEQINPDGITAFLDPGRILFVTVSRRKDLFWTVEEALRSGTCTSVVAELSLAPGHLQINRMRLAASTATAPVLGILLLNSGEIPKVDSRWRLAPVYNEQIPCWRLDRCKAHGKPPASWLLTRYSSGFRISDWKPDQTLESQRMSAFEGSGISSTERYQ